MKTTTLRLLTAAFLSISALHAADDPRQATVSVADDARVAAMKTPDRNQLARIFSDDLHYAHSNGVVDTKASLTDILLTSRTKYLGYDYEERKFSFPAPGIALMTGRARIKAATATGGMDSTLSFLAVWREEQGQWRFLAWQSCRLPPPVPAAK